MSLREQPFRFRIHQEVEKVTGYRFPGVIMSCFRNRAGEARYVVEADRPEFEGMLHIFSETQLQRRLP